ncbi:unnamed protein product [Boreogadus saida]
MKEQAALGGAGMVGLWTLKEQEEHDEGTFPVSGAMEVSRVRTCTAHGFSLPEQLLLSGTVLIVMKCCAVSGSGLGRPCSAQPQSEPEPAGCGQSAVCQPELGLYLPVSRRDDQLPPTPRFGLVSRHRRQLDAGRRPCPAPGGRKEAPGRRLSPCLPGPGRVHQSRLQSRHRALKGPGRPTREQRPGPGMESWSGRLLTESLAVIFPPAGGVWLGVLVWDGPGQEARFVGFINSCTRDFSQSGNSLSVFAIHIPPLSPVWRRQWNDQTRAQRIAALRLGLGPGPPTSVLL